MMLEMAAGGISGGDVRLRLRRRPPGLVLAAAVILGAAFPVLPAEGQDEVRRYNIPNQPLEQALSRFAQESGVDILLNDSSTNGRRSSPVTGPLSTPEALARLLNGTGLTMRFTSPRSAVIYPIDQPPSTVNASVSSGATPTLALNMMHVTAPRLIGGPATPLYQDYTLGLARDIRRRVVEADILVGGDPIVTRIRTRIDQDGTLRNVQIVTASNDRARAERVVRLLEGQRLAESPPADLPQPLIFDVRSR